MRWLTSLVCLWGLFSVAQAVDIPAPQAWLERHERPGQTGKPTQVIVNIFIVDILSIDDVQGTMTVDYFIGQFWEDSRLADDQFPDPAVKLDLTIGDIWNPHLSAVNVQSSALQESILKIGSAGGVTYRQRRVDTFTTPLDLKRFPFDSQVFRMKFLSTLYGPEQIDLVWSSDRSGHLEALSVPGWEFEGFITNETEWTLHTEAGESHSQTGVNFEISLDRSAAFYFWKVILPLAFIVFMSWTVFWIDPKEFGGQVAISTASAITLIAFQLSLVELLPKISYLTRIDIYAVATSCLVFLALGESILTARLAKAGKHQLALFVDRHMRWAYPAAYAIMLLLLVLA